MTIYYLKQDDTIWGCGDPACCGEYYEEISESFVNCTCEVEVNADHLHGCNGGGPVLKWRKAKPIEAQAYEDGRSEGWSDGAEWGEKYIQDRIVERLKPHRPTGKSVGGFLGVCSCGEAIDDYQEHLIALIKGEK